MAADDDDDDPYNRHGGGDHELEVHVKNKLPPKSLDTVLRIYCRYNFIRVPGMLRKIPLHEELVDRHSRNQPYGCLCIWNRRHQDFLVSGDTITAHCAHPGGVCKWKARDDGFYFLTATTGWKKIYSWNKR